MKYREFKVVNPIDGKQLSFGEKMQDDKGIELYNNGVNLFITSSIDHQQREVECISKNLVDILDIGDYIPTSTAPIGSIGIEFKTDITSEKTGRYSIEIAKRKYSELERDWVWKDSGIRSKIRAELYYQYNEHSGHIFWTQDLIDLSHAISPITGRHVFTQEEYWTDTDQWDPKTQRPRPEYTRDDIRIYPLKKFYITFEQADKICRGKVVNGRLIPHIPQDIGCIKRSIIEDIIKEEMKMKNTYADYFCV